MKESVHSHKSGFVHSFQSLGGADGPGLRYVVFLQGCPLRCGCCHNPDTWEKDGGQIFSAQDVVQKAVRCRAYFGEQGGVTLSGGEPLWQPEFVREVFERCHEQGIHTCLDTSGCFLDDRVKAALEAADRVLLDIKYTREEMYRENVGCTMQSALDFLRYLDDERIPVTVRQVIIPTVNDDRENMLALKKIVQSHPCVDKVELLPFRKICQTKYDAMKLDFPFGHLPEGKKAVTDELHKILEE